MNSIKKVITFLGLMMMALGAVGEVIFEVKYTDKEGEGFNAEENQRFKHWLEEELLHAGRHLEHDAVVNLEVSSDETNGLHSMLAMAKSEYVTCKDEENNKTSTTRVMAKVLGKSFDKYQDSWTDGKISIFITRFSYLTEKERHKKLTKYYNEQNFKSLVLHELTHILGIYVLEIESEAYMKEGTLHLNAPEPGILGSVENIHNRYGDLLEYEDGSKVIGKQEGKHLVHLLQDVYITSKEIEEYCGKKVQVSSLGFSHIESLENRFLMNASGNSDNPITCWSHCEIGILKTLGYSIKAMREGCVPKGYLETMISLSDEALENATQVFVGAKGYSVDYTGRRLMDNDHQKFLGYLDENSMIVILIDGEKLPLHMGELQRQIKLAGIFSAGQKNYEITATHRKEGEVNWIDVDVQAVTTEHDGSVFIGESSYDKATLLEIDDYCKDAETWIQFIERNKFTEGEILDKYLKEAAESWTFNTYSNETGLYAKKIIEYLGEQLLTRGETDRLKRLWIDNANVGFYNFYEQHVERSEAERVRDIEELLEIDNASDDDYRMGMIHIIEKEAEEVRSTEGKIELLKVFARTVFNREKDKRKRHCKEQRNHMMHSFHDAAAPGYIDGVILKMIDDIGEYAVWEALEGSCDEAMISLKAPREGRAREQVSHGSIYGGAGGFIRPRDITMMLKTQDDESPNSHHVGGVLTLTDSNTFINAIVGGSIVVSPGLELSLKQDDESPKTHHIGGVLTLTGSNNFVNTIVDDSLGGTPGLELSLKQDDESLKTHNLDGTTTLINSNRGEGILRMEEEGILDQWIFLIDDSPLILEVVHGGNQGVESDLLGVVEAFGEEAEGDGSDKSGEVSHDSAA